MPAAVVSPERANARRSLLAELDSAKALSDIRLKPDVERAAFRDLLADCILTYLLERDTWCERLRQLDDSSKTLREGDGQDGPLLLPKVQLKALETSTILGYVPPAVLREVQSEQDFYERWLAIIPRPESVRKTLMDSLFLSLMAIHRCLASQRATPRWKYLQWVVPKILTASHIQPLGRPQEEPWSADALEKRLGRIGISHSDSTALYLMSTDECFIRFRPPYRPFFYERDGYLYVLPEVPRVSPPTGAVPALASPAEIEEHLRDIGLRLFRTLT